MMEFEIKNMSCGHCVGAVTQAVKTLDPQAEVTVDLGSKKVKVGSLCTRDAVAAALIEAGYPTA